MSDTEEDVIDRLIVQPAQARLAAAKRAAGEGDAGADEAEQQPDGQGGGTAPAPSKKKRRRGSSTSGLAASAAAAAGTSEEQQQQQPSPPGAEQAGEAAGSRSLVGAVVIEGGGAGDARNLEVARLLRAPRYFDEVYEPKGVACWRCGKRGHLAKDCTGMGQKPCFYCAQYGHDPPQCPHRLCFRCGRPGHMTKECPVRRGEVLPGGNKGRCLRCGRGSCPAADFSDWFRFEGGCSQDYYSSDLDMARCFVCGKKGHLSCQPAPLLAPQPSCWNCGGAHWAEECPREFAAHLMAERLQDRDRQKEQRHQALQQQAWRQQQQQQQQNHQQQNHQQQQWRYQQQQHQQGGFPRGGGGGYGRW